MTSKPTMLRQLRLVALFCLFFCISLLYIICNPAVHAVTSSNDEILLAEGKAAIEKYLATNNIALAQNTEAYNSFLFEVLNDHHPALFTAGKTESVTTYIIHTLGLLEDRETISESPFVAYIPFVVGSGNNHALPMNATENSHSSATLSSSPTLALWQTYNTNIAVNYANEWVARTSGKKRNTSYPEFSNSGGDCTNFTSQVARAGGIATSGDGLCGVESTVAEWYIKKLFWPCNFAASTAWTTVKDFRYYMRDRVGAYVEAYPATNEGFSLLISRARPGDFIQFDVRACLTCSWVPTHGVAVVAYQSSPSGYYGNNLLYNDHSGGANGGDTYQRSLRSKLSEWTNTNVSNYRRLVWVKMR